MADSDPYAKYLTPPASAPAGSSDPYAKYLTPPGGSTSVNPAADPNAYQPTWLDKVTNVAADSATRGLADTISGGAGDLLSKIGVKGMPSTEQLRATTQSQRSDIGPVAGTIADLAGSTVGLGPQGTGAGAAVASKLEPMVGTRLASAASGATEAGILAGAGAAGHGEDPLSAGATGAVLGGVVGGALGGAVKPAVVGAAAKDIPTLQAEKDALYGVLNKKPIASGEVQGAIETAYNKLNPGELSGVSSQFRDQLGRVLDITRQSKISAGDVESMQRNLWEIAKRKFSPVDSMAAGKISDQLDTLLDQYGMTGAIKAAKTSFARLSDAQELPGLTINTAPNWAAKRLADPSMLYGGPEKQALANLAQYADKPPPTGFWDTMKAQTIDALQNKAVGVVAGSMHGLGLGSVAYPAGQVRLFSWEAGA